jgi:hypothetical protein
MNKLNVILDKLMRASAAFVQDLAAEPAFLNRPFHCCVRERDGSYVSCTDNIGYIDIDSAGNVWNPDSLARAQELCNQKMDSLHFPNRTAKVVEGSCKNSSCGTQSPTAVEPTNVCTVNRIPWARCLNAMNVGSSPMPASNPLDRCRKKLQAIVNNWLRNRCSAVDSLCAMANTTPTEPGSAESINAYSCYCDVERELLRGLESIVTQFCSQQPSMNCSDVDTKLKNLCSQYSASVRACKTAHPTITSPIRQMPNSLFCGF